MTFWQTDISDTTALSLNDLLASENCSLEEVLEDDFVLQEIRNNNEMLLTFLSSSENLMKMLRHAIIEPVSTSVTDKTRYKHANLSCEVLSMGPKSLSEDAACLKMLLEFVQCKTALNPLQTSFYVKIMSSLVAKQTKQVLLHVCTAESTFLSDVLQHVNTPALLELLYRFVATPDSAEDAEAVKQWLHDKGFVQRLLNLLRVDTPPETHRSVAQYWMELIRILRDLQFIADESEICKDLLLRDLQNPEHLSRLVSIMLDVANEQCASLIASCASILRLILSIRHPHNCSLMEMARKAAKSSPSECATRSTQPEAWGGGPPSGSSPVAAHECDAETDVQCVGADADSANDASGCDSGLMEHTLEYVECLLANTLAAQLQPITTLMNNMSKPGESRQWTEARLALVQLLAELYNINHTAALTALAQSTLVQMLCSWFEQYSVCSVLHASITQLFTNLLFAHITPNKHSAAGTEPIPAHVQYMQHLLVHSGLLTFIVQLTRPVAAGTKQKRVQWRGHVMQVASTIQLARCKAPMKLAADTAVNEYEVANKGAWEQFVTTVLAEYEEANKADNVELGGNNSSTMLDDEDFVTATDSQAQLMFSEFKMQCGMPGRQLDNHFGMRMDTYTNSEDPTVDALNNQARRLDFTIEDMDDTPPGELAFEDLCNRRLPSVSGYPMDESSGGKKTSCAEAVEDDPFLKMAEKRTKGRGSDWPGNATDANKTMDDCVETWPPVQWEEVRPPTATDDTQSGNTQQAADWPAGTSLTNQQTEAQDEHWPPLEASNSSGGDDWAAFGGSSVGGSGSSSDTGLFAVSDDAWQQMNTPSAHTNAQGLGAAINAADMDPEFAFEQLCAQRAKPMS